MRTLAQTGNGWMTFKDAVQPHVQPDRAARRHVVHLSNLCTEILEVTSDDETAVCNLGSINLGRSTCADGDGVRLRQARARPCAPRCRYLDRVIDINYYPIAGGRGVQPALAPGRPRRDGPAGRVLPAAAAVRLRRGARAVHADRRGDLPAPRSRRRPTWPSEHGAHPAFAETRAAARRAAARPLGRDARRRPSAGTRCARGSRAHGLRNSLLVAIAPTATIASIAGCYECIEPQVSNLFKRETLSGEFLQVNATWCASCKAPRPVDRRRSATRSSWPRARCRASPSCPSEVRALYRTAWEMPQRALIDMAAERGAVHRPEPVAEPVHGEPDHRQALARCTSTRGRPGSRRRTTCARARRRASQQGRPSTRPRRRHRRRRRRRVACSLENPETCEACQ